MRFYSLPPRHVDYPFLLVTMHHKDELHKRNFKHVILDSGVEIFKNRKQLRDYPQSFLHRYAQSAQIVSHQNKGRVWVVVPDYCDDLNRGQFGDNVTKTLENIKEYIGINGVEWMPVIQSKYFNRFSFIESCQRLHDVIGDYPRIAIGTVCKVRNLKFIIYCCQTARKFFPKSWIHAFGLTLLAIPKVKEYLNSWDSLACYFPRTKFKDWCKQTGLKPFPNASPFSNSERAEFFFNAYIKRIKDIGVVLED